MRVAAQAVGEEASNEIVCKSVEREVFARSASTSNQRAALRRGLLCGQQLSFSEQNRFGSVECEIWPEDLSISAMGAGLTKSISTGLAGPEAYYHGAWRFTSTLADHKPGTSREAWRFFSVVKVSSSSWQQSHFCSLKGASSRHSQSPRLLPSISGTSISYSYGPVF